MSAYSEEESLFLRSATVVEAGKVRTYLASLDDLTLNVSCGESPSSAMMMRGRLERVLLLLALR